MHTSTLIGSILIACIYLFVIYKVFINRNSTEKLDRGINYSIRYMNKKDLKKRKKEAKKYDEKLYKALRKKYGERFAYFWITYLPTTVLIILFGIIFVIFYDWSLYDMGEKKHYLLQLIKTHLPQILPMLLIIIGVAYAFVIGIRRDVEFAYLRKEKK